MRKPTRLAILHRRRHSLWITSKTDEELNKTPPMARPKRATGQHAIILTARRPEKYQLRYDGNRSMWVSIQYWDR